MSAADLSVEVERLTIERDALQAALLAAEVRSATATKRADVMDRAWVSALNRIHIMRAAGDFLVSELQAEHAVAGDNVCDGTCAVNRAIARWQEVRGT